MARKRAVGRGKLTKVKKEASPAPKDDEDHDDGTHSRELKDRKELSQLNHREVARQIVAIQAIRDAYIEHVLTQLQLTRSMFSKEQLQMPLLQFLKEYCPNTLAVKNSEGIIELERKTQNHDLIGSYVDEKEWRASIGCQGSIGHQAPMALDDKTVIMPTSESFHFTSSAVKDHFLCSIGMHLPNAVFQENSDVDMLNQESYFETPRMNLKMQPSIGMTPRSKRLPKRGELLLSIHGSPLGVYSEEKMDTISESEKEP